MTLLVLYILAACFGAAATLAIAAFQYRDAFRTLLLQWGHAQRARRKLARARRHLGR